MERKSLQNSILSFLAVGLVVAGLQRAEAITLPALNGSCGAHLGAEDGAGSAAGWRAGLGASYPAASALPLYAEGRYAQIGARTGLRAPIGTPMRHPGDRMLSRRGGMSLRF